ncbi:MAG: twin-arginine translocase TatA/TatE family subunit [Myxococcota bacterium]|nr:twin-arginine translocase subunit TatB [bacterium]MDP6076307.1 twin-arginine translocase TatA/TatE family subunit [Myxococcota bacterium]MDP6244460.1 twin-arginine translocase TatA/TatE family subunit [Myxococcota bacterium]MDP7074847.1 twin-arginine translocase TatA/TatE family subunit [Myxococcota bacterium]MDP7432203.1 twin-arginine translocase TatA/TatE family subunit [Myxococcota bacterium]
MFGIGMTELLLIFALALLVLGPKRLPDLARSLGRGLAEFRRASTDLRREFMDVAEEARVDPSDFAIPEAEVESGKDEAEHTRRPARKEHEHTDQQAQKKAEHTDQQAQKKAERAPASRAPSDGRDPTSAD